MVTEVQKAYLAGFIDGEGCFKIRRARREGRANSYQAMFELYNTDFSVLEWAQTIYGGRVNRYSQHIAPMYRLVLTGKECLEQLLRDVKPYVRVKGKDVDLMLKFLSLIRGRGLTERFADGRTKPLPSDATGQREKLYKELSKLHSLKGPQSIPKQIRLM